MDIQKIKETSLRRTVLLSSLFFLFVALLFGCENGSDNGAYKVGRDPNWYPLDLRGKEKNLVAFSDDLLVQIGRDGGVLFNHYSISSTQIERALIEGEVDAILSPFEITGFRQGRFVFSDPYFLVGPVMIVKKDSTIGSIQDLKKKNLGVISGKGLAFDKQIGEDVVILTFDSSLKAIESLMREEIDAMLAPALEAFALAQSEGRGKFKVIGPPLTQEGIRLIARKGEGDEIIKQFNGGLKQLRNKGEYKKLIKKWGLYNPFFD